MNLSPKIAYLFLLAIFLFKVLMATFFADYQVKEEVSQRNLLSYFCSKISAVRH